MHQGLVSCAALSLSVRSLVDLLACLFVVLVLGKVGYSSFLSLRLLVDRPYTMLCPLRLGSHEDCSVKHMGIATAVQWIPGHLVHPTCVTCGISLASQASLECVEDDSKCVRGLNGGPLYCTLCRCPCCCGQRPNQSNQRQGGTFMQSWSGNQNHEG